MTLRLYLMTMVIATVLCWLSFGMVLINVDPEAASLLTFGFFYASLFLSLAGTISLMLFSWYQYWWKDSAPLFAYVSKSFREGNVVAAFLVVTLFLRGIEWLSWWTGSLIATAFVLTISLMWSMAPRHETAPHHRSNNFI